MLYVLKRMNWDPEYRKDRIWQNRIKISFLNIWAHHCCITGATEAPDLPLPPLWVYFSQLCHYSQRLKQREFMQKQIRDPAGDPERKEKREGAVSIRKFAHPNLCTLGGAVCELLQVPLQGTRLPGELPGFGGKRWRKGSSRIKQPFWSAKETSPLTSRHLRNSQRSGAERPAALFLFWQHYSEWA